MKSSGEGFHPPPPPLYHSGGIKLRVRPRAGAPEAYLFQTHLKGGLFGREGSIYLEKTMVSVLNYKKAEGSAAEDENQIRTSSWQINHPGSVRD